MFANLIDVAPDPVRMGILGLAVLALGALFFTALIIVGLVLALKFRQKRQLAEIEARELAAAVAQPSKPNQL